jgi:hypothetical protein
MNETSRAARGHAARVAWSRCAGALLLAASLQASGGPSDARAIIEGVYRQDTSHDALIKAGFEIFDKDGHSTQKKFTVSRIGAPGERRTLVVFSDPQEIRGVALLSISRPGASARQYLYVPAIQRVRAVAVQQRTERFLGTDFSFEDIQERALDDYSYRLLGDTELIDGHKTYKIEATPLDRADSQYKFLHYWVAQDAPVIIYAEMFDDQGAKVRTLHATQLRRLSGIWGVRHTEVHTVREGTRTILSITDVKLNTGLNEQLFTPQALEASAGPKTAD